jgi:hypothetical protein
LSLEIKNEDAIKQLQKVITGLEQTVFTREEELNAKVDLAIKDKK